MLELFAGMPLTQLPFVQTMCVQWWSQAALVTLTVLVVGRLAFRAVFCLAQDQQLRVQRFTGVTVHSGPGLIVISPVYRSVTVVKVDTLGTMDFAKVSNVATGEARVMRGPTLLRLGAYEQVLEKGTGTSLGSADCIVVENLLSGERSVVKGPCVWFPGPHERVYKSASVSLTRTQYMVVEDQLSGELAVVKGPCVWFPGPHDKASKPQSAVVLQDADCILVEDKLSGEKRLVKGPCMWFPSPHELWEKTASVSLTRTEYIIVENGLTGDQITVKGPCVWFPGPNESASAKRTAIALQEDEYLRLKDVSSGQRWVQKGKALVFLEPTWSVEDSGPKDSGVKKAYVLKANEYVRLLDAFTGKITVHRGEMTVFPGADEQILDGGVKKAVEIDGTHAVLARDKSTGQLRLVTEQQLFVPGPNEVIEKIQDLIVLAEHEAMIVKDVDGVYQYYYGSDARRAPDQPRSFFLPAGAVVEKIWWSRGPRRERKDVSFERFDLRPHFMKVEFNCRTSDNVELVLEGVLFWEVVDLPAMFRRTGDTSGDMVYHIRSQFILQVARVTLKAFMEEVHNIAKKVLEEDGEFYSARGIKVHSLEVTRYQCADKSTSEILEQIIQETTSRMNRLSQAESENEVNLFRAQGQLEEAKLNSGLLEIQREQARAAAHAEGLAEADRVATFLKGLAGELPSLEERVRLWQVLRKTEALSAVAGHGANLFFTPSDVDLSIEARSGAAAVAGTPLAHASQHGSKEWAVVPPVVQGQ